MSRRKFPSKIDVLVIGGGPGGYVAAIRAGQRDLDVTLVERDAYGGTCLNYGCIPSKALITAAGRARDAGNAAEMGVHADPIIDVEQMVQWKDGIVDQLTGGVEQLCQANGVQLVDGTARFEDDHSVRVERPDGGNATMTFERCIVATGSRPISIPGFDFADFPVLSSRDALSLQSIPESLIICGAGYIGLELAGVFTDLGTDVEVVEMLDEALPAYPDDLTQPVKESLEERGVSFNFGEAPVEWWPIKRGIQIATEDANGDKTVYNANQILVAVGRKPVTDTLTLAAIGLEPGDDGTLPIDEQRRTNLDHVYAIGDVAGEPMLAHKASAEGIVAAETIASKQAAFDPLAIPAIVFTEPEIATVGINEAEATDAEYEPAVGTFPLQSSGRALTTVEPK